MQYCENNVNPITTEQLTAIVMSLCDGTSRQVFQLESDFLKWQVERAAPPAIERLLTEDDWLRQCEPLVLYAAEPQNNEQSFIDENKVRFTIRNPRRKNAAVKLHDNTVSIDEPNAEDYLQTAAIMARFPWVSTNIKPAPKSLQDAFLVSFGTKRHYFKRIILGRRPSAGLRFLDSVGLLEVYLPELTDGRNLSQNRFHAYDIFEHLLRACDGAVEAVEEIRWAALLHDIGKVGTRKVNEDGEASFHNHEMLSAKQTVTIMKRLGIHRETGQKIKFLVRNHMFHYTNEWSDKAIRRFMRRVSPENLKQLIALRLADRKGSGKKTAFPRALQKLVQHIEQVAQEEKRFKTKDLAINGHDLMQLGMAPGPKMGELLQMLTLAVQEGHLNNEAEILLARAQEHLSGQLLQGQP